MNQPTLARRSLMLLLAINLFCYLDRYLLAAIIPEIKAEFLVGDPNANQKAGWLTTAFILSYMVCAPLFGWLADRYSRWALIGFSVAFWSLAVGSSGLAWSFMALLLTRIFLGIGEAGYGPAAPTIISDLYPVEHRGRVLAWFFAAIPVGSALGYAFAGAVHHFTDNWRLAFFLVTPPGLFLAAMCFFMRDPRAPEAAHHARKRSSLADYRKLLAIPSLRTNILAQTALTFAIGGMSVWVPTYIHEARGQSIGAASMIFGGIVVVAGLISTLLGGFLGDRLRTRFPGSYFLVSGCGMLLGFPATLGMLYAPFPLAWVFVFIAIFFLFLNTGPSNTAIANVTPAPIRASAFALNILVIHALGDAISPPIIGWIRDRSDWNTAFLAVSLVILVAGILWLWGVRSFARDSAALAEEEARQQREAVGVA